ncbi:Phosphotransferase enzyme [Recurvomyces mirabilis]|nr:Phosphotransferase enzyme [Recurvomyces mirabilis]
MQEKRPQLVAYQGEVQLQLPTSYETIEDKDEKARVRNQVEKSILKRVYEQETEKHNTVLHSLYQVPHIRTRAETVTFASQIWEGDTIPLRECLIRLERSRTDLLTDTSLDTGEILTLVYPAPSVSRSRSLKHTSVEAHKQISEGWNETADIWSSLDGFVSSDGYTAVEDYDEAREMFAEMREERLSNLEGKEAAE